MSEMKQYITDACRTKSNDNHPNALREIADEPSLGDALHASIGLVTEAGEMLDAWKKHVFYGKPLDLVNLREEAGDMLWYLAVLFNALGTDFETQAGVNIAKLKARYPTKFTFEASENRNLEAEREILEGKF